MCTAHPFSRVSRVALLIGLLAAVWAGGVQGQEPGPEPDMARFLEQRIREPDLFSPYPAAEPGAIVSPQSLHLWQSEVVDAQGGGGVSFKLDAAGRPHISYLSTDWPRALRYAYYDGAAWQIESVESGVGYWIGSSLALDATGQPRIAYYHDTDDDIKYAYRDGAGWHVETVDSDGWNPVQMSLAIDDSGHPHISYYDSRNQDLKYAHRDGTAWHIETVDSKDDVGYYNSLVLDAKGYPHISYSYIPSYQLKYASYDGSSWRFEWPDELCQENSLALDSAGHAHIACIFRTVKHFYQDGTGWQRQTVDTPDPCTSISIRMALDAADRPHIAYCGQFPSGGGWRYARWDGTMWYTAPVDVGGVPTLAVEPGGRVHAVYGSQDGVKHATYLSHLSGWSRLTYASYRDMNWEIYAARGDGLNPIRLTHNSFIDTTPELDRGGTHIVFRSNRDGNNEIYRMNVDGSGPVRLTWNTADDYTPTWSPDGSRIAFYSNRDGNAEIYVMDADGSNQTRLTFNPEWDGHPAWSPDGSRIVFVSQRTGSYWIYTMAADGTDQAQLGPGAGFAAYPDWSPDGSRIAYNDDENGDGWFELVLINADGTDRTCPLGYSTNAVEDLGPDWSPHSEDLAFSKVTWIKYYGNYYWSAAQVLGMERQTRATYPLGDSGYDWWPDWQPTEVSAPSSRVAALAPWSGKDFTVTWTGDDGGGIGLKSFDVQFRDGSGGAWTDWLLDTTETSAAFTGEVGHTYYFRCRARDLAANLEPYPEGDGDTSTHVYGFTQAGRILGNRDQPLALAAVESTPPALNVGLTGPAGSFALYFDGSGVYDLEGSHAKFGALPPMVGVEVAEASPPVTLYLPPADDRIADGGFEAGDLAAWDLSGTAYPALVITAHTGDHAVLLDGADSRLSQAIALPSVPYSGTLSLLYRAEAADLAGDGLAVSLRGASQALTFTVPLAGDGWVHWWADVESWAGPTATLEIAWTEAEARSPGRMFVDEVSLGTAEMGAYALYVPVALRVWP